MQSIHIAMVDDEEIQLNFMEKLIQESANKLDFKAIIHRFDSGEAFLFGLEDLPQLDIALLDIQMKAIDGMQVAEKIREKNQDLTIVFVTAYAEYAVAGYSVNALDYLLKPIDLSQMVKVFERFLDQQPKQAKFLLVDYQGEMLKINQDSIIYIEAAKHQSIVTTSDAKLTLNMNLSSLQSQLDESFISTHRSYLVNLAHVEQLLKQDVLMSNEDKVPLSRRSVKAVQQAFINYYKKEVFYE